jgi:hypothetical protein
MCNPECPRKTGAELAQAARRHLQGYDAAVEELQRRGYTVKPNGFARGELEIYTMRKENI